MTRSGERRYGSERGAALIVALMAMLLLTSLGLALVVTTSTEALVAANYRSGVEAMYAADAAMARAIADLTAVPDWNLVLAGLVTSAFADGWSGGTRRLSDGATIDLTRATNRINCGVAAGCSLRDMDVVSGERPWGANNPRWQVYAHAPIAALLPEGAVDSPFYAIVWVADDPSENDGDPTRDGSSEANPGAGILSLRAEAFGPGGSHAVAEATVVRPRTSAADTGPDGLRILSWRHVR